MISVATLGPAGTFSDMAAQRFFANQPIDLTYTGTIRQVFDRMVDGIEYGVVPVENLSEGFVQPTLEALLDAEISIVGEIRLAVQFSFISGVASLADLKTLYVQPVAFGQCSEFISSLENVTVIRTNSNIESLELQKMDITSGAIVPHHVFETTDAGTKIEMVSDLVHNETRFWIIRRGRGDYTTCTCPSKCSLIIRDDRDHSGILNSITAAFTRENINITSIISRPTRETMGKYHFFIDIEGSHLDEPVARAINSIAEKFPVTVLGSYCKAV